MSTKLSPQLEKLVEDYEQDLLYQDSKSTGGGQKKPGKSLLTAHKQIEFHQQALKIYQSKLELHHFLYSKLTKPGSITAYTRWLQENLNQNKIDIDKEMDRNVKTKRFASTHGPGGQNINKLATAIRLIHLPTLITVKHKKERSQEQNIVYAKEILKNKLQEHLNLWSTAGLPEQITPHFIENFISQTPQPPRA